ncbi:pathogenesis-related protein PR-1-like [Humulus lupulus]|uniref:pathogenesis-related protein PR-1-like n=1 Tax=Humulus lupulus TaxID=3486 RepID=UPI002B403B8D|nr:pathogenesis-related protein PR-1-like [Humulus lupulus]
MAKPHFISMLLFILYTIKHTHQTFDIDDNSLNVPNPSKIFDRLTEMTYGVSHKHLCFRCIGDSSRFLAAHNLARAEKGQLPLLWEAKLARHARRWASQRKADCALRHSSPIDGLGENIFWGGGSGWTPTDAVRLWAEEEKDYSYKNNSCAHGQMCGHYTQIVWRSTRRVGCARVICDSGDTFMICNYDPPGNYIGEKPY